MERHRLPRIARPPNQWEVLYTTDQWHRCRQAKLASEPVCERCNKANAVLVHHVQEARYRPDLFFSANNLRSLCHPCHEIEHKRFAKKDKQVDKVKQDCTDMGG